MLYAVGCSVALALTIVLLVNHVFFAPDYSLRNQVRRKKDARFSYELTTNQGHLDENITYKFDLYMRKSRWNHLIMCFENFKVGDKLLENISAEDNTMLSLPFIIVERDQAPFSIHTFPSETTLSIGIKGETALLMGRNFSYELWGYHKQKRRFRPDVLNITRDLTDLPIGRFCPRVPFQLVHDHAKQILIITGRVTRDDCLEPFGLSSDYQVTGDSSYEVSYYFHPSSFRFLGADSNLVMESTGNDTRTIYTYNKMRFAGHRWQLRKLPERLLSVSGYLLCLPSFLSAALLAGDC